MTTPRHHKEIVGITDPDEQPREAAVPVSTRLTIDDIDQIIEGIDHFIISGDPAVQEVWQPYLDKLAALRAGLEAPTEPGVPVSALRALVEEMRHQPNTLIDYTYSQKLATLCDQAEGRSE
jgi:hypothetical protein